MRESSAEVQGNGRPLMAQESKSGLRYEYLDGLRGVAIILVIMTHVGRIMPPMGPALTHIYEYGGRGVQLFFVVSGFTLMTNYQDKEFKFREFLARRVFRVAPMFYLGAFGYIVLGQFSDLRFGARDPTLEQVLLTLTFLHGWSPGTIHSIVPGGWSIASEMMFYLSFPLVLIASKNMRVLTVALVMSFILSLLSQKLILYFIPNNGGSGVNFSGFFWITQWPAFVIGCATARWARLAPAMRGSFRRLLALLLVICLPVSVFLAPSFTTAIILYGLLMVYLASGSAAWLTQHFLAMLGRISFSVYIIHFFVVSLIEKYGLPAAAPMWLPVTYLALVLAVTLFCVPIGLATFNVIEKPAIHLGRRLLKADKRK